MRNYYWLFLLFCSAIFSPTLYAKNNNLVFAIDIISVGEHTPVSLVPNDPIRPSDFKEGMGQLTAFGMKQTFNLGVDFRKQYIDKEHLLPSSYHPDSIRVNSAARDRTMMSAQSLLYGLYPLGIGPRLEDQTPVLPKAFQPIPIHTIPVQFDCVLYDDCTCKKKDDAFDDYFHSSREAQNKTAEYQDKLARWEKVTGKRMSTLYSTIDLAELLSYYKGHGLPFPGGLDENDYQDIQSLAQWSASRIYAQSEFTQYMSQGLLCVIARDLKNVASKTGNNSGQLKYVLFSTFFGNLMSLMNIFQNPLSEIPPYASNIKLLLFESQTGDYIVNITYNGNKVKIPSCEKEDCTLSEFIAAIEDKISLGCEGQGGRENCGESPMPNGVKLEY